jgi:hypothetical protein
MEREGTSPWLGFRLAAGEGALGLYSGELPAGSGRWRCHDDDQGDTESSPVWSSLSIVSREGRGGSAGAAMGGGGLRPSMFFSISCRLDEGNKSGWGAWARWRDRREREGWGSLAAPKSTRNTCRYAGLRRGISQSSLRLERRSKRGEGEDARGYL